jgi:branched-chain amino acid transport system permease protein
MLLPEILVKILFNLINGLIWALIMALIALGLSLIFGLMGIVNIAHGEFYMWGAMLTWFAIAFFKNTLFGIVLTIALLASLGAVLERGVLRTFMGRPTYTVIATIGISYILQQVALAIFGGWPQAVPDPIKISIPIFGVGYPVYRLLLAGIAIAILVSLLVFLYKTSLGLQIRAAMQDEEMASAMGIPVSRIYTITFVIGAVLAGLGGALAAPIVQVFYLMGLDVLAMAFIIVIIGGLGSLRGTIFASLIMCPLENLLTVFITPTEARVVSLLVMAVVLLFRPQGLFGGARG